jgi:hypothetical protein
MHPRNAQFTRIRHGSTPDLKYRRQRRRWPEMRSGSCLLRLLRRLVHRGLGKADWRFDQEDMQSCRVAAAAAGRRDEQALTQVNQRQAAMFESGQTVRKTAHSLFPS